MIQRMPFGHTGRDSSRVVFGAAGLGAVSQGVADQALDVLLEHGVNHIDVAAGYGDAELRAAPWLQRHPGTSFVATKTGSGATGAPARRSGGRWTGSASTPSI